MDELDGSLVELHNVVERSYFVHENAPVSMVEQVLDDKLVG